MEQWMEELNKRIEKARKYMKFEEKKMTPVTWDLSRPVEYTVDPFGKDKASIPVISGGHQLRWELGLSNPVLKQMSAAVENGEVNFVVIRTGQGTQTRYELLGK